MRDILNRSKEHWALIPSKERANTKLAIFVHGFRGGYLDTWGRLADLLSQNADASAPFDAWDYLFIGYDTSNIDTYLDIASLVATQVTMAESGQSPFRQAYSTFAFFGHSLGTLGIRQLLCAWTLQSPTFLGSLHGVVLFGTPLNGSPLGRPAKMLWKIGAALEPLSPQLRMLKSWAEGSFGKYPWKKAKVVLGLDDRVVGHRYNELVEWPGDVRPAVTTNFDHGDLVKPDSWTQSIIIDHIRNTLA